jgi:hypothetical protein
MLPQKYFLSFPLPQVVLSHEQQFGCWFWFVHDVLGSLPHSCPSMMQFAEFISHAA